ncbi:MAG TPA: PAS domain S-box protein [Syntrophorhabdales bacterium]|nr:PAS domain S-box protein [Syntrophorhabdales bacterium]
MAGERILIVEDEGIVARETEYRLKDLGYNVCGIASSGPEAINKAEKGHPDVVLMDIMLKGEMDGIEAAEQIHANLGVPVVYVTAHADETTLQRAKRTEPMGYLLKPFNERELHAAIEIAIYKHRTESMLKDREQLLSTTLKSIGDAVIVTDIKGAVTFMNPAAELLTRWKLKEASGLPVTQVFSVVSEATHALAQHPVMRALSESVITTARSHVLTSKDGRAIQVDGTATPIMDDVGGMHGAVLVFRDVAGPRRADESLRVTQHAVDLLPEAVLRFGPDGRIFYANDAATRLLGYTWDDFAWMSMQEIDPALRGSRWELHMERIREKVTLSYETSLRRKKGDSVAVQVRTHYFLHDHSPCIVALIRDIAQEKALIDNRLQDGVYAQGLIDSASVMIIGLDREGAIRTFNKEVEVATGYGKGALEGKNLFEVILPISKNVSIWRSFLDWQASRLQLPVTFEAALVTRSGTKRLISWCINETKDEQAITGLVLVGIDVTDQKQMEQHLALRNEELHSLRRVSDIVMKPGVSRDEVFQSVSAEVASAIGYPFVAIEQYNEERQNMVLRGVMSLIPVPPNMEVPLNETLSGAAIRTGHLLVERAAAKRPEYANGFLRKLGISTYICAPITVHQRVFGALTLGHTEAADVSEQLQHYATAVANQLAFFLTSKEILEGRTGYEETLHEFLEAWPEAVFECANGKITEANGAAVELLRAPGLAQLVGKPLLDQICEEGRPLLEPYLLNNGRDAPPLPFTAIRMMRLDGSLLDAEAAARIMGAPVKGKAVVLVRDDGKHKDAERKAHAAAEKHAHPVFFYSIGTPAFVAALDSTIVAVNEEFEKLTSYSKQELEGVKSWHEFIVKEDLPVAGEYLKLLLGNVDGAPRRHDLRVVDRQGTIKEMRLTATVVEGSDSIVFSLVDMRERRWAEQAWLDSEKKYRQIVETVLEGIWVLDADGSTTFVNDRMGRMLGYSANEMMGKRFFLFIDVKNAEKAGQRWDKCRRGLKEEFEAEFIRKDGQPLFTRVSSSPILDDTGVFRGSLFSVTDLSDMKAVDEKVRGSLQEREACLREIHHRVKNNLQIIASLLYLQSKNVDEPRLLQVLLESLERVRSISLVHEQLYKSEDLTRVKFTDYLSSLTTNIFQTYSDESGKIELKLDVNDSVSLDADKAVPCGLIVNELVSNALKHAFVGRGKGIIHVSLLRNDDGILSLTVGDDGTGLPPDVDFRNTPSLGFQLVHTLVNQLGATIELERKEGTVFSVTFA